MAVAFDAVGPSSTPATSSFTSGSPAYTWSHNPAAGAALLVAVGVDHAENSASVTGVTFGGTAMTLIAKVNQGGLGDGEGYLYGLANVPGGSATVTVSVSGTSDIIAGGSVSYTGAGTTFATAFGTPVSTQGGTGTTATESLTSTSTSSKVVGASYTGDPSTTSTAGTQRFASGGTSAGNIGQCSVSDLTGTASSQTVTWTMSNATWCMIMVEVLPGTPLTPPAAQPQPGGRTWRSRFRRRQAQPSAPVTVAVPVAPPFTRAADNPDTTHVLRGQGFFRRGTPPAATGPATQPGTTFSFVPGSATPGRADPGIPVAVTVPPATVTPAFTRAVDNPDSTHILRSRPAFLPVQPPRVAGAVFTRAAGNTGTAHILRARGFAPATRVAVSAVIIAPAFTRAARVQSQPVKRAPAFRPVAAVQARPVPWTTAKRAQHPVVKARPAPVVVPPKVIAFPVIAGRAPPRPQKRPGRGFAPAVKVTVTSVAITPAFTRAAGNTDTAHVLRGRGFAPAQAPKAAPVPVTRAVRALAPKSRQQQGPGRVPFVPASGSVKGGPLHILLPGGARLRNVLSANTVLPAPKVTITGLNGVTGAFSITLPKPVLSFTLKMQHNPLHIALPKPVVAVTGKRVHNNFNIVIPKPVVTVTGVRVTTSSLAIVLGARGTGPWFLRRPQPPEEPPDTPGTISVSVR